MARGVDLAKYAGDQPGAGVTVVVVMVVVGSVTGVLRTASSCASTMSFVVYFLPLLTTAWTSGAIGVSGSSAGRPETGVIASVLVSTVALCVCSTLVSTVTWVLASGRLNLGDSSRFGDAFVRQFFRFDGAKNLGGFDTLHGQRALGRRAGC